MFACRTTSSLNQLHTICSALFHFIGREMETIHPSNPSRSTRMWKVVYLIQCIIDRTPSRLSMFLKGLMDMRGRLYQIYGMLVRDPNTIAYLARVEVEHSPTYVIIIIIHHH